MTLFKIEIKEFFNSVLYKNKDGQEKLNIGSIIGLIIGLFYIIGISILEGLAYKAVGQIENLITFGMLMCTYMTFLTCLSAIPSSLFNSKDYLVNATLPIKSSDIVTTKLLALYVICIMMTLAINVICCVVRIILVPLYHGVILLFLGLIFVSLLLPLLPMAICGFIGYISSLLKGKISGGANTIITLLSLILLIGLGYLLGYSMGSGSAGTFDKIASIIPSIKWGYGAINGEPLDALLFLVVSAVPFVAFAILASLSYEYINSLQPKPKKISAKTQERMMNNSSSSLTLKQSIKKEFTKMFSNPQFVMTNLMGCLVALLLPIIEIVTLGASFSDDDIIGIQVLIPFITLMMLGAMPPANRFISYEGNDMALTKSLPIDGWTALKGKYFATILVLAVTSLLYMIEVLILGQVTLIFAVTSGVGIFGLTAFENTRALLNDAKTPLFHWNNFNELARKENRAVINLLISMGLSIVVFGLSIWVAIVAGSDAVGILYFVIGSAMFVINNLTVKENIIKYYDQIEL